jgi:DNA topoisomerase VI subunit B
VVLKELVDNALDACEFARVAPKITITVDKSGITVADNGPGIPLSTIDGILDYSVRVSSCEAYCSPTRGAQGNALKTILAMPFVLDGNTGRVDIAAHGQRHEIVFAVDRVRQQPNIARTIHEAEDVQTGTKIKVHWPDSASSKGGAEAQNVQDLDNSDDSDPDSASEILADAEADFVQLADDYTFLNPHLTLTVDWFGKRTTTEATAPEWLKWLPTDPTPAHWYGAEEFERLIAAYISDDQDRGKDRSVRELVAEFRGLARTGKQKAVLEETELSRVNLSHLANGQGMEHAVIAKLLDAMKQHSKPVKPITLGVIGRAHIEARFAALGCPPESFAYKRIALEDEKGLPIVIEAAFGWRGGYCERRRRVIGVNWSGCIANPFRKLGNGDGLVALLERRYAGHGEPIVFFLHYTCPRTRFMDRGKSSVALDSTASDAIVKAVESVTEAWYKQRKREERDSRAASNRQRAFERMRNVSVKDAAWQVMREAYMAASAGGTLPAKGRQIYYRARGPILKLTGKTALDAQYFEQTLLPEYQREHPEETSDWDVAYDARGTFHEPHSGNSVPLGTLEVRKYLADVMGRSVAGVRDWLPIDLGSDQECGPAESFGALLYIEKQGFDELFSRVRLAERFDLGILSAKGQSVTACRHLADELCGTYGIPLFVLHDFDLAGFNILHTLRNDTRRYEFKNQFEVVDLGLRLADAKEWGLESERVCYGAKRYGEAKDPRRRLEIVGATAEEAKFLCSELTGAGWCGQRIELNAFTSDKLVEWIESKLTAAGVKKIVPERETLETAYRRALQGALIRERLTAIVKETRDQARKAKVPRHLDRLVSDAFKADLAQSWADAVATAAGRATCTKRAPDQGQIQQAESAPRPANCTKPKRRRRAA